MSDEQKPAQPALYAVGDVVRIHLHDRDKTMFSAKILGIFTNGASWFYTIPPLWKGGETGFISERDITGLVTPGEM